MRTVLLLGSLWALAAPVSDSPGTAPLPAQNPDEADDRSVRGKTADLVDVAAKLEKHVNSVIRRGRERKLTSGGLAKFVFKTLGERVPGTGVEIRLGRYRRSFCQLAGVELWMLRELGADRKESYRFRFPESRYGGNAVSRWQVLKGLPWLFSEETAQHGMSPTLNVGGVLMGTDKWGHFFQQGYWYYDAVEKGALEPDETAAFGMYMEGDPSWNAGLTEEESSRLAARLEATGRSYYPLFCKGIYGSKSSGVISAADNAANSAGHDFYRKLTSDPAYRFRAGDFDLEPFNESTKNPNVFVAGLEVDALRGVPGREEAEGGKR